MKRRRPAKPSACLSRQICFNPAAPCEFACIMQYFPFQEKVEAEYWRRNLIKKIHFSASCSQLEKLFRGTHCVCLFGCLLICLTVLASTFLFWIFILSCKEDCSFRLVSFLLSKTEFSRVGLLANSIYSAWLDIPAIKSCSFFARTKNLHLNRLKKLLVIWKYYNISHSK